MNMAFAFKTLFYWKTDNVDYLPGLEKKTGHVSCFIQIICKMII